MTTKNSSENPEPALITATPGLIPAISDKINTLVHTEDGKNGYLAGTNNGLYRSYDIAKGWEKISFGENVNHEMQTIFADAYQPETIWVGTAVSGVMVSRDNGATWIESFDNSRSRSGQCDCQKSEETRLYVYRNNSDFLYEQGWR